MKKKILSSLAGILLAIPFAMSQGNINLVDRNWFLCYPLPELMSIADSAMLTSDTSRCGWFCSVWYFENSGKIRINENNACSDKLTLRGNYKTPTPLPGRSKTMMC